MTKKLVPPYDEAGGGARSAATTNAKDPSTGNTLEILHDDDNDRTSLLYKTKQRQVPLLRTFNIGRRVRFVAR
jgi:hypothetical protein